MIHAHSTLKLGRPGGPSTQHKLRFATFVDKTKVQAPAFAFGAKRKTGMFGNNRVGNCTCATIAGQLVYDAAAHGESIDFGDDAVIKLYEGSGYKPGDSSTDNGWSMEAADSAAQHTGLVDTSGVVRKTGPSLQINYHDPIELQIALDMFGSVRIGAALPLSAQDTSNVWDTDGSGGNQEPGSWGGHSDLLVHFERGLWTFHTWGGPQDATDAWRDRYVDEAIVAVDPLWCSKARPAPDGFLIDDLIAAMAVLR